MACAVLLLCGCAGLDKNINDNFSLKYRSHGIVEKSSWAELHSKSAGGTYSLLWPLVLDTESICVSNNIAVFVARRPRMDGVLLAARAGHRACDISGQLTKAWCDKSGYAFTNVVRLQRSYTVISKLDGPEVHITAWSKDMIPSGTVKLSWAKISALIDEVERKGKLREVAKEGYWARVTYRQLEE